MKTPDYICSVMAAAAILFCIALPAAAEKQLGTTNYANQAQTKAHEMVQRDFKVERVFISEVSAPDVPLTSLSAGGNYQFNCEISYTGVNAGTCTGGTRGYVSHKVDGILTRDDNACLAPSGRTMIRATLDPASRARVFSFGSHTYECRVDPVNGIDTSSGNNAMPLAYSVKLKKVLPPGRGLQN